jgi:FkbM family methyltransferase
METPIEKQAYSILKSAKIIFDVGSFDGSDYLAKCEADPDCHVYAFEPQPLMVEQIKAKTSHLPNFHLFHCAVADYDGEEVFYLSGGGKGGLSSLKNYAPDKKIWGDKKFGVSIKTKVIKLKTFIEEHKISHIDYFHCDAQGTDLLIVKGLEEYHKIVRAGDIEAQVYPLYEGAHTKEEAQEWMASVGWESSFRHEEPARDVNIFFVNANFGKNYS